MAFVSLSNTDGEREHGLSKSFNKLLGRLQPAWHWASGSWRSQSWRSPGAQQTVSGRRRRVLQVGRSLGRGAQVVS